MYILFWYMYNLYFIHVYPFLMHVHSLLYTCTFSFDACTFSTLYMYTLFWYMYISHILDLVSRLIEANQSFSHWKFQISSCHYTHQSFNIMLLNSLLEDKLYFSLESFVIVVKQHADSQRYAVIVVRIKVFKIEVKRKAWLRCDRENKHRDSENQQCIHESSRLIDFSFNVVVKRVSTKKTE